MNDGTVPRWTSLGPVSLIRDGPWELILPQWIVGLVLLFVWLATPWIRVPSVTDWRAAAIVGGGLCGAIAVCAFGRVWADPRVGGGFAISVMAVGAIATGAASRTILAPIERSAIACAPSFVTAESSAGRIASFILPVALFIAWCLYLIAHFPRARHKTDLFSDSEGRYRRYSRAIRRVLPLRLAMTAIVCGALAFVTLPYRHASDAASPGAIVQRLANPAMAATDRAGGGRAFALLTEARRAEEAKALALLGDLDLDHAVPAVRRSACEWLTPGDRVAPRIADAAAAFDVLDDEVARWQRAWTPSAATAAAVLRLVPLRHASDDRPSLFPLQWDLDAPFAATPASYRDATNDVTYGGEPVLRLRRTFARVDGRELLVGVDAKLLGIAGRDETLPQIVSERLGAPPDEGPCAAGDNYCASWKTERLVVRIGAGRDGDDGLWLTLYDPRRLAVQSCCDGASAAGAR